jgi:hypothetical protein
MKQINKIEINGNIGIKVGSPGNPETGKQPKIMNIESTNKSGKCIIKEVIRNNDIDNPEKNYIQAEYIDKSIRDFMIFQVVSYDSEGAGLKHVHCKVCNNEWRYNECICVTDKFIIADNRLKIQCLACGIEYDFTSEG